MFDFLKGLAAGLALPLVIVLLVILGVGAISYFAGWHPPDNPETEREPQMIELKQIRRRNALVLTRVHDREAGMVCYVGIRGGVDCEPVETTLLGEYE